MSTRFPSCLSNVLKGFGGSVPLHLGPNSFETRKLIIRTTKIVKFVSIVTYECLTFSVSQWDITPILERFTDVSTF